MPGSYNAADILALEQQARVVTFVDEFDFRCDFQGVQEGRLPERNLAPRMSFDAEFSVRAVIEDTSGDAIWIYCQQSIVAQKGFEGKVTDNLRPPIFINWGETVPIIITEQIGKVR